MSREFKGAIELDLRDSVQLDLGDDANGPDHQGSEEERYRVATARR